MATFAQVSAFLRQNKIEFEIIDLSDRALTVEDVVKLSRLASESGQEIKIDPEEVCKTIIVKTPERFMALLLKGTHNIDFKKLKKVFGKTRMATREEVKKVAGVEPGAVCPIQIGIKVIVDPELTKLTHINMGSGDHRKGLIIEIEDLLKLLDYKLLDIRKD